MTKLEYTIKGTPVTKKNSQQMVFNKKTGRWFPVPSKAYKQFEKEAKAYLSPTPNVPISYPVNITCKYFLPLNKDGSIPKKLPDLSNLLEATDDILVKHGILEDDNIRIIWRHDGSYAAFVSEDPRTEITITQIGEVKE